MTDPVRSPLRVIFVINSLEGGGAERVLSTLLARFAADAPATLPFTFELALLDRKEIKYDVPQGVVVHQFDCGGALGASLRALHALIRRRRPDVVFSFLTRANFAAVVTKLRTGTPCIISERVNTTSHFAGTTLRARLSRGLVRLLYRRADRVVAVSQGVAQELSENYAVAADRLAVIHNPVDLDGLRAAARQPPAVALPDRFVVAVGRLTANKNHAMLLRAFAASGITADLVLLGEGECRSALEEDAAALGIAERVHFLGFVENPYAVIARAAAFVSASNAEGFPNATAEAMALGRPVLSTDCPSGPAELLDGAAPPGSGVVAASYGVLVPVGDEAAMAEGLRRLAAGAFEAYGDRGRARMETFRAELVAQRYAAIVDEVLRRARRPSAAATGGRRGGVDG